MNKAKVIKATEKFVQKTLAGDGSGHDWWHILRVRNNAMHIAKSEKADKFVVELGALLHDIADWKFHDGTTTKGANITRDWLTKQKVPNDSIERVCHIVEHVSFKGAGEKNGINTIEGMIVQDADRLDALGAIGVARAFAYGGHKNRPMHDPKAKQVLHRNFTAYKNSNSATISHFYEKLLLLKDRMNTKTGKRIATKRHKYMENYLKQFFAEWNGKL